nr:hypothetical protein [Tanacetum cinerariifolium]
CLVINISYVLHAAVLEVRDGSEIKLLEGVGNARILLQKAQRLAVQPENNGYAKPNFGRVRFAVQEVHGPAAHLAVHRRKLASRKRKQRRIGYGLPLVRHRERQRKCSLQIGLVENWEHRAGAVGHEQGVKVVVAAIERLVARYELNFYLVAAHA